MPSISKHSNKNGATFIVILQLLWKVYFSFEIGMRKPNSEIYKYVLNEHDLQAKRTLFIDDKKKYWRCALLGLQVWNLQVGKEDVDLFNKNIL
jgi:putative hydrolase of the HAD superfamily